MYIQKNFQSKKIENTSEHTGYYKVYLKISISSHFNLNKVYKNSSLFPSFHQTDLKQLFSYSLPALIWTFNAIFNVSLFNLPFR